jgi:hypothetical protein
LRETEEGGEMKYQMVSLDHKYLLFGHGRSAWLGLYPSHCSESPVFADFSHPHPALEDFSL